MSSALELYTSPDLAHPYHRLQLHKTNYTRIHIKKSKEKYFKHKYCKDLKRKLKKYKLRHDGEEDQDILDVSSILVSNLKIKSPLSQESKIQLIDELDEEQRPKNYLFKMGRRKQPVHKNGSDDITSMECETNISAPLKITVKDPQKQTKVLKDKSDTDNLINDITMDSGNGKKTNVFKLMMDSRNKSIGINSPGKEKNVDSSELEEAIENKKLKVKRTLILQKMAEQKGSLKNKEMEEYQDKLIKKKMDQRAQRLKKMITDHDKPTKKHASKTADTKPAVSESVNKSNEDVIASNKNLKLFNLFEDPEIKTPKRNKKPISKEDQEFINKLSPSIKKKENMLSYFKKIEKEDEDNKDDIDENEDNSIIKVKLSTKVKKKPKKKKLSLNKANENDHVRDNVEITNSNLINQIETVVSNDSKEDKPRKDKEKRAKKCELVNSKSTVNDEVIRPRRNIKRPAKYIDEVELLSSDEELHIFTPKKKKPLDNKHDDKSIICITDETTNMAIKPEKQSKKIIKSLKKDDSGQKKASKLAPIFNVKPTLDAAAIEAKQRFLSSGVPEKLKKIIEKQNTRKIGSNDFNAVVHVQQLDLNICKFNDNDFDLRPINEDISLNIVDENGFFNKLLCNRNLINKPLHLSQPTQYKVLELLQSIKQLNPKFPVYRTYRLLRDKSKGEFRGSNMLDLDNSIEVINGMVDMNYDNLDTFNWTDKYKPMASKQILGNFDVTRDLKKWLVSWTENNVKTNRQNDDDSDFSDFYQSDTDSMGSIKSNNNLLILTGPVGSGKTSMVYALAAELAMKVLEVNASSKRTGKIMLQDLQEATQSHKVNRGKSSSQELSQKLIEITESKEVKKSKRGRKSKKEIQSKNSILSNSCEQLSQSQSQSSQDSSRTCMSLILIDDADIVFDQDDGFCSAIVQLIQSSKRPVILITSTTTCPHLQRFLTNAKIMHTRPFVPNILGPWLDIMCLTENNVCWPGLGARFLDYFKGDIRKTINYLQFYLSKESTESSSQNTDCFKIDVEDESSNMGWSDFDGTDDRNEAVCLNNNNAHNIWQYFMMDQIDLLHNSSSLSLFDIWWNVPMLLDIPEIKEKVKKKELQKEKNCNQDSENFKSKLSDLEALANTLDVISVSDFFSEYHNDDSITDSPWLGRESHCVSEQGSLEVYSYCKETMAEISHALVSGVIINEQNNLGLQRKTNLSLPGFAERRKRDQIVIRHNNVTKYLNPSAVLDRKALALDYWSGSRTICRIERTKTDSNLKRNNRFCHYLKSVNVLCNNETFDHICGSLNVSKEG